MKKTKRTLWTLIIVFALMNIIAAIHAYKFTHFTDSKVAKTKKPEELSAMQKINALVFGVSNPRPVNQQFPGRPYETIKLQSNKQIECWWIKADTPKGAVILFHGYGGEKSTMLGRADELLKMGYGTLLVDFMGSGGSEGKQTTIGYLEAEEVKTCYDYLRGQGNQKIFLFGTSMGAVAIIKAIRDYGINPEGIILECPFGTLYKTTCARFRQLHTPVFPMAGMLDFWGGVENGFNAFSFNPAAYATAVKCPALLMYGACDVNVSRSETDEIYANLGGTKQLVIFPLAGHENYLTKYKQEWVKDVSDFMGQTLNQ